MRTVSIIVAGMLTVAGCIGWQRNGGHTVVPGERFNPGVYECVRPRQCVCVSWCGQSWLRQDGDYKITEINRNSDGSISSVFVISQKNMVLVYFPNRGSCEEAIVMGLENGTLNNPKELG